MSFCVKCGRAIEADGRFCSGCGAQSGDPTAQPSTPPSPRPNHLVLKFSLALVVVAGVAFAAIGYGAYTAKEALGLHFGSQGSENATSDEAKQEDAAKPSDPKNLEEAMNQSSPEAKKLFELMKQKGFDLQKIKDTPPTVLCRLHNQGERAVIYNYPGAKLYLGSFKEADRPIDNDPTTYLITSAAPGTVTGWLASHNACLEKAVKFDDGRLVLGYKDTPTVCMGSEQAVAVRQISEGTLIEYSCPPTDEDVENSVRPIEIPKLPVK